jgi:dTDP-4-amino-4,6-dideoxygalactose transaminase
MCYPEFNNLKLKKTEDLQNTVLSLPINSILTNEEIETIIDNLNNFV